MPCRVVLPTSSMSRVRTHFCTLVARGYGAGSRPVRYGMNGTMPATVNSSDGSGETSEALGTTVCPRCGEVLEEAAADLGGLHQVYSVLRRPGPERDGVGGTSRGQESAACAP